MEGVGHFGIMEVGRREGPTAEGSSPWGRRPRGRPVLRPEVTGRFTATTEWLQLSPVLHHALDDNIFLLPPLLLPSCVTPTATAGCCGCLQGISVWRLWANKSPRYSLSGIVWFSSLRWNVLPQDVAVIQLVNRSVLLAKITTCWTLVSGGGELLYRDTCIPSSCIILLDLPQFNEYRVAFLVASAKRHCPSRKLANLK